LLEQITDSISKMTFKWRNKIIGFFAAESILEKYKATFSDPENSPERNAKYSKTVRLLITKLLPNNSLNYSTCSIKLLDSV